MDRDEEVGRRGDEHVDIYVIRAPKGPEWRRSGVTSVLWATDSSNFIVCLRGGGGDGSHGRTAVILRLCDHYLGKILKKLSFM